MTRTPSSKHFNSQFVCLFSLATPSLHIKEALINDAEEFSDELWARKDQNMYARPSAALFQASFLPSLLPVLSARRVKGP